MRDRTSPAAPDGYATVNPFIITDDADGLIAFLGQVFGATERREARTVDDHHREAAQDHGADWSEADGEAWDQTSPELQYIHDTLLTALPTIADPRLAGSRR
jgi:hypothetical protein